MVNVFLVPSQAAWAVVEGGDGFVGGRGAIHVKGDAPTGESNATPA
jgi:hypothetical protein